MITNKPIRCSTTGAVCPSPWCPFTRPSTDRPRSNLHQYYLVADLVVKACVATALCFLNGIAELHLSLAALVSALAWWPPSFSSGVRRRPLYPLLTQLTQEIYASHLSGRTWPIALSTGFGIGAAYADCDRSFNPARVPGTRLSVLPATSPSPVPAPAEPKQV